MKIFNIIRYSMAIVLCVLIILVSAVNGVWYSGGWYHLYDGYRYTGYKAYGGDAYTGIQNATADVSYNVQQGAEDIVVAVNRLHSIGDTLTYMADYARPIITLAFGIVLLKYLGKLVEEIRALIKERKLKKEKMMAEWQASLQMQAQAMTPMQNPQNPNQP